MSKKSIQDVLNESFPKSNKEDWRKTAIQELEGKDPFEALSWNMDDKIFFYPYYDVSDVATCSYLKNFQLPPSTTPYTHPRAWLNLPKIIVTDFLTANQVALNHLNLGADGVLFALDESNVDWTALLEKIDWPYCHLSLHTSEADCLRLAQYIQQKNYAPDSLSGTFFWKNFPANSDAILTAVPAQKKLQMLGVVIPASSATDEIVYALKSGVEALDHLSEKGINPAEIVRHITFSLAAEKNFLLQIAKLKALRLLWFQVVQAYGVNDYALADLHIHTTAQAQADEKYKPHGNMLNGTLSAIASILGGCNALTVEPEEEGNSNMNRIARNVSNILREESHLGTVADPLAGAFAIDNMVHAVAKEAWDRFKT